MAKTEDTKKAADTKGHDAKGEAETPKKGETADELHALTTALKGDVTKLASGGKAEKQIARWEQLVESIPGAKSVHGDLGKLREALSGGEPDGKAIARILHGLSTKTGKIAEDTGGVVGTALKSLAGALEKAGTHLTDAPAEDDGDEKSAKEKQAEGGRKSHK